MCSLVSGCCGAAAVQYSWNNKLPVLAGNCVLILCCFVFFLSKAGERMESCLPSAEAEQICFTCRTSGRLLRWKQVKKTVVCISEILGAKRMVAAVLSSG